MSKKQTAVDWLATEILKLEGIQDVAIPDNLFHIAIQKEREQIEEAYKQGDEDGFHSTESQSDYELEGRSSYLASKYYTQTYG